MSEIDPASVLGPEGAVARRLQHFESRPQQLKMAKAVASAIEKGRHLMVEAGTGVGKSFAYLVPAIIAAVDLGKKVVVSTHTISLQEQLLNKDLPFLRSVMPQEFTAVLVKGRGNYISLRRLDTAIARSGSTFVNQEDIDQLGALKLWAASTQDGSRSDLKFRPSAAVWDSVVSEDGNCLGRNCPRHGECHYFKARRRMRTANILVVNHALFMTDLAVRAAGASILPDYDVAIFDEAHTLEAVACEHLGARISNGSVEYLLNRLHSERTDRGLLAYHKLKSAIDQVQRVRQIARDYFDGVAEWYLSQNSFNGRIRSALNWPDVLSEELRRLAGTIGRAAKNIEDEGQRVELSAAEEKCVSLAMMIDDWLKQSMERQVYWVDVAESGRRRVELSSAPIDVGQTLRKELFDKVPTCVLASATLCVGTPPRFDFYKERLGLTSCESLQLGSPFDYPKQVTVHLPKNLPDPSERAAEFEKQAIQAIPYYLEQTNGKAFVLFTSNRMLETAARELTPWFVRRNIKLLAQTDGMDRSKMLEAYKADVNSVIFGAESFWQGVDVPGEALSNVIIVKLPFSVPTHPLLEARLEAIRQRGGNPFVDYQVPEAVIKLKQGFGRLIRTKRDSGIVVILDPRVWSKPYGRTFLNSLPDCPRVVESIVLPQARRE